MKKLSVRILVAMAAAGMVMPHQAFAETAETAPVQAADVVVSDGVLSGVAVTPEAQPVVGTDLVLKFEGREVARTRTGADGRYEVRGVRQGLHTVVIGATEQNVRFWGNAAAPPAAKQKLVTVVRPNIVRGQDGELLGFLPGTGPGSGIGLGIGTLAFGGALAATLSTTLDDDDPAPASP